MTFKKRSGREGGTTVSHSSVTRFDIRLWLLTLTPCLFKPWQEATDGSSNRIPAAHAGDWIPLLGLSFGLSPVLRTVGIWEVNQWMRSLFSYHIYQKH